MRLIEGNILIIDAHTHLPNANDLLSFEDKRNQYLSDMKKNGVDHAIIIPDNEKDSPHGSVSKCIELFQNHKEVSILGTVSILEDDISQKAIELDKYFSKGQICGIKIYPGHDHHYPNDERLTEFYNLCIKHNRPFVIHTGWNSNDPAAALWNDPKYIIEVANNYPNMTIIICHLFWPDVEYCAKITEPFENIHFDTSALADNEVLKETSSLTMRKMVLHLIHNQKKKLIFGTDYKMCSVKDHIDYFSNLNLTVEETEKLFYLYAQELYRI